jgi:hypothetical protein
MSTSIVLAAAAGVAMLYGVLGTVIVRRSRRPTCRVCLYRGFCPSRDSGVLKTTQPCWSCGQTACAEPTPKAET